MTPLLRHKNGTLFIDNTPLQSGAVAESYLTAEGTSGSSTITIKNILGFGINQILLIEDLGTENAEVILTHASSTPSGTTVTLASNLVKTHPVGSKVRVIVYNQFELKRGTTTTAGDATALTTATTANFNPISSIGSGLVAVDPTMRVQVHESSEHTSGYYFARYKNSITSDFSGYTDALAYGGWDTDTVGYAIDQALREVGVSLSEKVTREDCYAWLTEVLREIEGKQVRWPEHYKFNYALTTITAGDNSYTLPTDIYDSESNRSILAIRFGNNADKLTYLDPLEFEELLGGVATTTAAEAGDVGETALDITNAGDFEDSGTVYYYASGTQYSFTYTGKSTNTLTGIPASGTGSITQAITSGDTLWQGISDGKPTYFTVKEGSFDVWPLPSADYHGKNIYLDYALVATAINSDGDTLDYHRYDMLLSYLTWRIWCKARNNGMLDLNNGFYALYKVKLNDAIRTAPPSQIRQRPQPRVNRMLKR